jgi:FkbH-like protein
MSAPTAATCSEVARTLERIPSGVLPWPEVRVAVLASFTVGPIAPFVTAVGALSGLLVRVHVAGGDDWAQQALDPSSGLRQFSPDVLIVALELEDLAPSLVHDFLELDRAAVERHVTDAVARIRGLLENVRQWSSAKILMHSLPLPLEPSLGILDPIDERGQTRALRALDTRVREHASSLNDAYVLEMDRLIASVGRAAWRDARMWTLARMPFTPIAMQALAEEYLRYLRAFTGRSRKVLVLDLDGTLWGGIVGEDGPQGIQLGVGHHGRAFVHVQRAVRELMRRGVLLAINSTNNADDALEVLEQHPAMVLRKQDFAALRINWQDKAANLTELSQELGLSLDTFVFADDNASECERVRQALPEVLTVHLSGDPATFSDRLKGLGVFDTLSYGDEDRARTTMYQSEAQRRDLEQSMSSIDDFLRSLEMELDVEPLGAQTLARAAELTQRTNQFNLTTHRFTPDELKSYLAAPGREGFVFRLRDRFGDHGLVGLALAERNHSRFVIETLLLSCRVLKRTVEDSVLSFLADHARDTGAEIVEGQFRPTRKNAIVASLYESRGFDRTDEAADGTQRFVRRTADGLAPSAWISSRRLEQRHA